MSTTHGYIRLPERDDDALDYRMDDLYDYGVDAQNIVFDIDSDTQLRTLLRSVLPGDVVAIADFTHIAPTSVQGRTNIDELHCKGATLHIGDIGIEPDQPVSQFITNALLAAVDAGETRLGLVERGLASGMKVTDESDGRLRVGYSPSGHPAATDALHRQGVLGRNIIIGDPTDAIERVTQGGTLVLLDAVRLWLDDADAAGVKARLAAKSVTVEVDGTTVDL